MADQKSTDTSVSPNVKRYYEKRAIERLEPTLVLYKLGIKRPIPQHNGTIIEFNKWTRPFAVNTAATEFASNQLYLSATTVTAQLTTRKGHVQFSDYLVAVALDPVLDEAVDGLSDAASETVDTYIRNTLTIAVVNTSAAASISYVAAISASNTMGITPASTAATARAFSNDTDATKRYDMFMNQAQVTTGSLVTSLTGVKLTLADIQHAVSELHARKVHYADGKAYDLVLHPDVIFHLKTANDFKQWFQYTTSDPAKNDGVGMVLSNCRVHMSHSMPKFTLSGGTLNTTSGAMYGSLLLGKEAFAVTELAGKTGKQGFQLFINRSGEQSTNDPNREISQVAFRVIMAAKILQRSAGIWILSTKFGA